MKRKFAKLTIEVYKNNKLENTINCDPERVEEEFIQDLLSVHFFKNGRISESNYYNKIKITYYETIGKDKYKTIRIYE